jgi:hypothetical protein
LKNQLDKLALKLILVEDLYESEQTPKPPNWFRLGSYLQPVRPEGFDLAARLPAAPGLSV